MPDPVRSDTAVSTFAFTEDKTNTLWTSHDKTHAIERTAVETALNAAAAQNDLLKEYLKNFIESELRTYSAKLEVLYARVDALSHKHDLDREATRVLNLAQHRGIVDNIESWESGHAREHVLAQLAIDKAEAALAVRLEGLNEARARAADERGSLATKSQLDDKLDAVQNRIALLERGESGVSGRNAGLNVAWAVLTGGVALLIAVAVAVRDLTMR